MNAEICWPLSSQPSPSEHSFLLTGSLNALCYHGVMWHLNHNMSESAVDARHCRALCIFMPCAVQLTRHAFAICILPTSGVLALTVEPISAFFCNLLQSSATVYHLCCMQLQQQVQEKTAAAAVVQRERDLLEMHMEDQQDMFDHQMTWMTTENEEVSSKAFVRA